MDSWRVIQDHIDRMHNVWNENSRVCILERWLPTFRRLREASLQSVDTRVLHGQEEFLLHELTPAPLTVVKENEGKHS
eukprot:s3973_g3.t1